MALAVLVLDLVVSQPAKAQYFTNTGSLANGRYVHTATLLSNGKVLVAGGIDVSGNPFDSAELYDPTNGVWNATRPMTIARDSTTATKLMDGRVLVAGGYNGTYDSRLSATELYDPTPATWTLTGALKNVRMEHTAVLLGNGKVLVAGGYSGNSIYPKVAELYDPTAGTWALTGAMSVGRRGHTETLLANGKVLVAGGYYAVSSAELYDPVSGTWTATGDLNVGRGYHTATLLANGKVLIAGGYGKTNKVLSAAELYDPASGTWIVTGELNMSRQLHTATLLPNGNVLVAGGGSSNRLQTAELYDPVTGTWTLTDVLKTARYKHTATLLANGNVLVAGGYGTNDAVSLAELYISNTVTNSADYADYIAPGEKALLSKPILLNGTPYQGVGITTSALTQFTDLFDPATYWQPPVTLSDPYGGSEPSVIALKTNISTAFLVHYYSNGVWQICSDEFTRAWVYHLALAEVQAHYRTVTALQKGVYLADTAHYARDLAFRDTEAFWFPTCWAKWLPLVGDGEQRKYSLAAFEQPLDDYTTFGLMGFFGKQYLPLPIDTKTKDFAARITDGTVSVAKVLDFEKRRYQYIPPVLGGARGVIHGVGLAWELTQDLQDIFTVEVLDTEKLTLMSYLDDRANAYQTQYGDLNPDFVATLNVYVTNNANVANQVWMQLQNKAVSQGWTLAKDYVAVPLLSRAAPLIIHFLNAEGLVQVPATTFLGVTLTAAQTASIYPLIFSVTVDVAANPEGVYEQRILSYYRSKNAIQWEKVGIHMAQEIDNASNIDEMQADSYLLLELIERQTYGNLCQNLVAATEASFAGNFAAGLAANIAPDDWRWTQGTALSWNYLNQHWNDVVRYMVGRTRLTPQIVPDTQLPTVTITSPTTAASFTTNRSPITLSGTSSDNVGVLRVAWSSSSGDSGSCTGTNTWSSSLINLMPGTNALTVTASDAAGNVGKATLNVVLSMADLQPPQVLITAPTNGGFFQTGISNVAVGANVSDDVGVVSATWTNSRGGGGSCRVAGTSAFVDQIPLYGGDNLVTLKAYDASGKSGSNSITFRYVPTDTTAPTVQISYPSSQSQFSVTTNIVSVCGTAADAGGVISVSWTNNRGGSGLCSGTYSWVATNLNLLTGDNLVTVAGRDSAGNIGNATILLRYATNLPTGSVVAQLLPPEMVTNNAFWQLDQGAWHYSGEVVSAVSTGLHLITFSQVVGYQPIANMPVDVKTGQTSTVTATYLGIPKPLRIGFGALPPLTKSGLSLEMEGTVGLTCRVEASTNLVNWVTITNLTTTVAPIYFYDATATNFSRRFYRIAQGTLKIPVTLGFTSAKPWSTNGLALMLQGPVGSNYVIQASTNLINWQQVTNFVSTNATMYFRDSSAANFNRRFYRALLQ